MELCDDATPKAVRLGTLGALALAKDNRIESITFPALGTGVGGVSLDDCAKAMLPTISRWLREHELPGEVRVMLFREDDHKVFMKMWDHLKLEGEL
jgi:O-acetyl-ADP-ribose deacetylase (regulator of RNase III)